MALVDRLSSSGPKQILALDGGGIRGALTVGFLKRIEQILRERHGRPDLLLCDYFDLIGGTSTGAIIAAALSIGMSADEVTRTYLEFGGEVFNDRADPFGLPRLGLLRGRYNAEPLKRKLEEFFGERTLGDESIRTGLCIVTKRADTSSTWPLINHSGGRYYPKNHQILLRDAVRASTAAPTYFDPEEIDVGDGVEGAFVDGGREPAQQSGPASVPPRHPQRLSVPLADRRRQAASGLGRDRILGQDAQLSRHHERAAVELGL